ncbi:PLP-dependent aminotransferase family protein [Streptomyces sp. N2-109]|uniref:PLP-dependent aminotransferase family protein n=1 Tax=Streptomyces gossypii TaxID=2883101 RepID=A0ABT2JZ52_9ACTN|nr:PLP-dependent aminotransferase family protein [Streptomyces gossypii]MCT2593187.1 PLP-dependent aminotransferase family protein [Streptomyces gossypii]
MDRNETGRPGCDLPGEPAALVAVLGDWMRGPGPLYRKLAAALARAVRRGDLRPGERLPSERALAAALSLSRATVSTAYEELRGPGVLDSLRGSGTRVAGPPLGQRPPGADGRVPGGRATSLVQRLVDGPEGPGGVISLATASAGAVPQVREALLELAGRDLDPLLTDIGYHPRGLPALREALAAHCSEGGTPTSPGQVLVTTGATQALALVARLYLRRRDTVVVEQPSWPGCLDAFRALGVSLHGVPMDEDGVRPDALDRALRDRAPALLFVMPTYHNPTGTLMSGGRRRRVAELAARHRVPVVEDLAYDARFSTLAEPPPIGAHAGRDAEVLSVGSLAKSVWGGLRIGWIRGPEQTVERLARLKTLADLGGPVLEQVLAARLVPQLPGIRVQRAAELRERLAWLERLLAEHLPSWRWRTPDGGSALWVRLPDEVDAGVYAQVALRHGVEVVPGAAMDPEGAYDSHIRVPYTLPLPTLTELVRRLAAAWDDL